MNTEFEARQLLEKDPELKKELSKEVKPKVVSGLKGYTAAELLSMELPPVKFIIDGILPEGLTLIAGRPKIGKSWLMMGLSVSISTGGLFLDSIKVGQGRVLYLALEDNERRLAGRLKMVLRGDPAPDKLHLYTEWPRVDQNGTVLIEKFIEKYPDTRLIVIDTLQKIKAKPKRSNSTLYQEDYESVLPLKAITDKYSIGIVLVHHTRKSGSDDAYETISGTTGLTGGTDAMMVLSRDRARCDGVLYITGRDIADKELALKWDDARTAWSILGNAAEYRMSQERQVIINLLRQTDTLMSPKEIATALNKNYSTIKVTLSAMFKEGQINNDNGKYYYKTINSINNNNYSNCDNYINSINPVNSTSKVGLGLSEDNNSINRGNPSKIETSKESGLSVYGVYDSSNLEKECEETCPF